MSLDTVHCGADRTPLPWQAAPVTSRPAFAVGLATWIISPLTSTPARANRRPMVWFSRVPVIGYWIVSVLHTDLER
jgi:hypothetical protein